VFRLMIVLAFGHSVAVILPCFGTAFAPWTCSLKRRVLEFILNIINHLQVSFWKQEFIHIFFLENWIIWHCFLFIFVLKKLEIGCKILGSQSHEQANIQETLVTIQIILKLVLVIFHNLSWKFFSIIFCNQFLAFFKQKQWFDTNYAIFSVRKVNKTSLCAHTTPCLEALLKSNNFINWKYSPK
jgi:hypothetical protein